METALWPSVTTWAHLWELPGLVERLAIHFSPRLRSTWGRAYPARGLVTLAASLRAQEQTRILEVLCHEVAHIAVHLKHGRAAKPHGPEWAALVIAAGFSPSRRLPEIGHARRPRTTSWYEHRCPVCQARRVARRPVKTWRCAACTRGGLSGQLTITRLS